MRLHHDFEKRIWKQVELAMQGQPARIAKLWIMYALGKHLKYQVPAERWRCYKVAACSCENTNLISDYRQRIKAGNLPYEFKEDILTNNIAWYLAEPVDENENVRVNNAFIIEVEDPYDFMDCGGIIEVYPAPVNSKGRFDITAFDFTFVDYIQE